MIVYTCFAKILIVLFFERGVSIRVQAIAILIFKVMDLTVRMQISVQLLESYIKKYSEDHVWKIFQSAALFILKMKWKFSSWSIGNTSWASVNPHRCSQASNLALISEPLVTKDLIVVNIYIYIYAMLNLA